MSDFNFIWDEEIADSYLFYPIEKTSNIAAYNIL